MASFDPANTDVVFLLVSGAKGALDTAKRAQQLIDDGNRVNVIATPTAASWIDHGEIETVTGWSLRVEQRMPHESTFEPRAGRVLASPVTLNTLTKWAQGHADNLVIGLLCEALGAGIPTRAEIQVSAEFAIHPAAVEAVAVLRRYGIEVGTVPDSQPNPELAALLAD